MYTDNEFDYYEITDEEAYAIESGEGINEGTYEFFTDAEIAEGLNLELYDILEFGIGVQQNLAERCENAIKDLKSYDKEETEFLSNDSIKTIIELLDTKKLIKLLDKENRRIETYLQELWEQYDLVKEELNTNYWHVGNNIIRPAKFTRSEYLRKIIEHRQYQYLESYFTDFPDEIELTLTVLKKTLPDNIDEIASRLGFEEKLRILRVSNNKIEEFEKKKTPKALSIHEYFVKYNSYYNTDKKKDTFKIIYEVLIYLPFDFEKFMEMIQEYLYDETRETAQKMMMETYGVSKI